MKSVSRNTVNFVLLVLLSSLSLYGQGSSEERAEAGLKMRPADVLRMMNGPDSEVYTIGEGDELTIDITGHPELSGKHTVGPDGKITLPIAGSMVITGLTREAAAKGVTTALTEHFVNLNVIVRVDKYGSNRIVLLGRVANPGVLLFDRTPSLLEVLSRSGGFKQEDGKITRESMPGRCAIFRGSDQVVWIDLKKLLASGSPDVDLRLKRNDVVFVPADQEDLVTVLGEVQSPGVVRFDNNTTIPELLAQAGGVNSAAAKTIRFVRPSTGLTKEISMNDLLLKGSKFEIAFERGDILYVPKSGFSKVSHVLQQLSPAGAMLLFAGTLAK